MSKHWGKCLIAAVAVVGAAFFIFSQAHEANSNEGGSIAAVVNGHQILRSDVEEVLSRVPQQPGADKSALYPIVLDQMINDTLLLADIDNRNLDQDAEVQRRLDEARKHIIRTVYVEREIAKALTDRNIKAEYNKLKKEFRNKNETRASHILLTTEAEAKSVIADLEKGAKFEDLARARSEDKGTSGNGGDLGYFMQEDMLPEFADAAFKIKPGTYSKTPVRTQFGWHVIYVHDRRKAELPELEKVEPAIKNKLGQEAVQKLVQDLRKKADIKRFGLDGKPLK